MQIIPYIEKLIKLHIKPAIRTGTVKNVDKSALTCDVWLDDKGDLFLPDVKIKSTTNTTNKGIVVIPKEDTVVTVCMIEGYDTNWCLLHCEEIESVFWVTEGKSKIEIKDNGEVHLNGNTCGNLMKIKESIERWNFIEKDVNNLKRSLNGVLSASVLTATPTAADLFHTAMKGALTSWCVQELKETIASDIENDKVKHGNNN